MMKNLPEAFPKIIETEPAGEDLLDGGSQERIATAIKECLEEKRFKLIGIDGKWGSGKSNVIKIVRKSLGKEYLFFIYDAWAHQEDLKRRSFLEELNRELIDAKWLNGKVWEKKLRTLLSISKDSLARETPKVNNLVIYMIVLMLGHFFAGWFITGSFTGSKAVVWNFGIDFILGLILYLVIIKKQKRGFSFSELYALLKLKETEKYLEEKTLVTEPSVGDFRNWMQEISKEIHGKHLVVVMDNMDRLPSDKVVSLWSHLHTFFSGKPYDNISVLVPFDRIHIGKAFGDAEGDVKGTGDYFISKTFPVVFSISDVPLAGWKKFFGKKYKEAFGDLATESEEVTTIFDRYHKEITPREIIAFINTIVSLKLIWKNEIEMRYLALYAATRKDYFKEGRSEILTGGYASSADIIFREDEKLPGIMAALYYNIPPEIASEVTLYRDIEVSVRAQDLYRLKLLSEHSDFFVIMDNVATTAGVTLDRFAPALFQLEEQKSSITFSNNLKTIWNHLIGKRMIIHEQDQTDFTRTDEILLLKAKGGTRLNKLAESICRGLADSRNFSGKTYGIALLAMDEFIAINKLPIDISSIVKEKLVRAEHYLEYAGVTKEKFSKYNVLVHLPDLEQNILQHFPGQMNEIPAEKYLTAFRFQHLQPRIEQHIRGSIFEPGHLEGIYSVYKLLAPAPLVIPDDTSIQRMITSVEKDSSVYYELAAMKLANATKSISENTEFGDIPNNTSELYIGNIASRILHYCGADDLLSGFMKFDSVSFSLVVKDILINRRKVSGTFGFNKVFSNYFKIREALGVSDKELIDYLSIYCESLQEEINSLDVGVVFADEQVIPILVNSDSDLLKQITRDSVVAYLSQINKETWIKRFEDLSSYDAKLLQNCLKYGLFREMPQDAAEGLGVVLYNLVMLDIDIQVQYFDNLKFLYAHSNKTILKNGILGIRDWLLENFDGNPNRFLLFEPMLKEQGDLNVNFDEFIREVIIRSIKDTNVLSMMVKHQHYYLDFYSRSAKHASEFIIDSRKFIEENEGMEGIDGFLELLNEISFNFFGPINIIKAEYISSNNSINMADVTQRLKDWVENEHRYFFKLTNAVADADPEHGFVKDLVMEYEYRGELINLVFRESHWVKLPYSQN